jgi:hypothetical protein
VVEKIDEATGKPVYKDLDGKEGITDADRCSLGSSVPDFTYGLTLALSYKNFDIMAYGAGAQGAELMYGLTRAASGSMINHPRFLYTDRWTSANTNATQASSLYQMDERYFNSDKYVFDASYFKVKQIQLGYTVLSKQLRKIDVSSLRIYVSLDNFFTFTSYPGSDPEVRTLEKNSAMAIDLGSYPIARTLSFGLNISL